jgi:hypothetical protein
VIEKPIGRIGGSKVILLGEVIQAREAAWEYLLLLAREEIVAIATEWHQAVWELENFARSQEGDPKKWNKLWEQVDGLRKAYYQKARLDLGIGERPV